MSVLVLALTLVAGCDWSTPVGHAATPPRPVPRKLLAREDSPWKSRAACLTMLEAQKNLPPVSGRVRVGSWNIRTFPDGEKTDVPWLACAIALMDVPLLAVQEIKSNPPARKAGLRLIALLNEHTGGRWKLELEQCGNGDVPHVGILFDATRVTATRVRAAYSLRPTEKRPCGVDLHPGLRANVAFHGGPRFEFVSVHLPSGPGQDHATLRRRTWRGFHTLAQPAIVAGDFNTSGCDGCEQPLTPQQEIDALTRSLRTADLLRVPSTLHCSEYFDRKPWLLDHVAVSDSLRPLVAGRARIAGYCAELACRQATGFADAHRHLSDHCPVVLELVTRK